jgi:hypothetical protein
VFVSFKKWALGTRNRVPFGFRRPPVMGGHRLGVPVSPAFGLHDRPFFLALVPLIPSNAV